MADFYPVYQRPNVNVTPGHSGGTVDKANAVVLRGDGLVVNTQMANRPRLVVARCVEWQLKIPGGDAAGTSVCTEDYLTPPRQYENRVPGTMYNTAGDTGPIDGDPIKRTPLTFEIVKNKDYDDKPPEIITVIGSEVKDNLSRFGTNWVELVIRYDCLVLPKVTTFRQTWVMEDYEPWGSGYIGRVAQVSAWSKVSQKDGLVFRNENVYMRARIVWNASKEAWELVEFSPYEVNPPAGMAGQNNLESPLPFAEKHDITQPQ